MKLFALVLLAVLEAAAQPARPVQEFTTNKGVVKITPIQHASLMIEGGGKAIHVDPWSQGNYEGLPPADIILITDIHGDHLDPKALPKVQKSGTAIFAPEAVAKTLSGATVIRNGETRTAGDWVIEAVPMYNLKRGPSEGKLFHDKGRGDGFVLTYGGKRFYISGDTEGTPEMKALKNIDVAFVCMNLPYTMPPEEAAEAVKAFKPKVVYPYHYRGSDLKVFESALAGSGVQVKLIDWYYK
ncbi:MAG TPA: MBL fold metallo-hydrolase [Bryobacteraceae bacterium]|nr:MBL fold metallo-hydrolase [Bryobacteraceae bacterium]